MVKVSGIATQNTECGISGLSSPYTILMPKLGGDNNSITNAEACTCQNLPIGLTQDTLGCCAQAIARCQVLHEVSPTVLTRE